MKMKLNCKPVLPGVLLIAETTMLGQGTFRNLDFESANIPVVPAGQLGRLVSPEDGLPGWTVYAPSLVHNGLPAGGSAVVIFGPEWSSSAILQGRYSVGIFTGVSGIEAIGQSGRIPEKAKSVQFFGKPGVVNVAMTFRGNPLSFFDLGGNDHSHIYGADISGYAGQTGELRFTGVPPLPNSSNSAFIDNIEFSPIPIPEPTTLTLLFGGLLGFTLVSSGRRTKK
jgi:hypothetical protein